MATSLSSRCHPRRPPRRPRRRRRSRIHRRHCHRHHCHHFQRCCRASTITVSNFTVATTETRRHSFRRVAPSPPPPPPRPPPVASVLLSQHLRRFQCVRDQCRYVRQYVMRACDARSMRRGLACAPRVFAVYMSCTRRWYLYCMAISRFKSLAGV